MERPDVSLDYALLLLIPSVILLHLLVSPYTKIEESFSIQALHDVLAYGIPFQDPAKYFLQNYDHVNFPQPVPRSFIGPLVVAGVSKPWLVFCSSGEQAQVLGQSICNSSSDSRIDRVDS